MRLAYLLVRHVCASDIGILNHVVERGDDFIRLEELPHGTVEESARHGGRVSSEFPSSKGVK
jgi:hypothetical protein